MFLENTVLDIIDGKKRAPLFSLLLRLCSLFYASAIVFYHLAFRLKVCKTYRAETLVVSVGNIACGGTGKTPFVRFLAKALSKECKVAILSRGYRSSSEHLPQPLLITGKERPLPPVTVCGDEPYLLASSLPDVDIWVGKHRHEAARLAAAQGRDIVILDDGMQYRKLHRDSEIVILDGRDILGSHRMLPFGRLRDFPRRLIAADLIVINHVEENGSLHLYEEKLRKFTRAPLVAMRMRSIIQKGESIAGQAVGVFCALGRPEHFFRAVEQFPCHIVARKILRDHDALTEKDVRAFAALSLQKGAQALVCSAKDAVKLSSSLHVDLPLVVLDVEVEILKSHLYWDAWLASLKQKRKSLCQS